MRGCVRALRIVLPEKILRCISTFIIVIVIIIMFIIKVIIKFGTVTASDMIMHQVLFILTLTFIQGHTDILHVQLFQKVSSNADDHVCCEDGPTKDLYNLFLVTSASQS